MCFTCLRFAALCLVIAGASSPAWSATTLPPLHNKVLLIDAEPEQMAAFDRALRPLIPTKNYEHYGLGCVVDYEDGQGDLGCDVMKPGHPIPDDLEGLVYYFNDNNKALLKKFEIAERRVRQQFPNAKLFLDYRQHEERKPDCSVQPQPCVFAPYCQQYGNCSTQTSTCKRCY